MDGKMQVVALISGNLNEGLAGAEILFYLLKPVKSIIHIRIMIQTVAERDFRQSREGFRHSNLESVGADVKTASIGESEPQYLHRTERSDAAVQIEKSRIFFPGVELLLPALIGVFGHLVELFGKADSGRRDGKGFRGSGRRLSGHIYNLVDLIAGRLQCKRIDALICSAGVDVGIGSPAVRGVPEVHADSAGTAGRVVFAQDDAALGAFVFVKQVAALEFEKIIPLLPQQIRMFVSGKPELDIVVPHEAEEHLLLRPGQVIEGVMGQQNRRLLLIELLQQVQKKLRTDDQIALPTVHIGERGVNVEQVKVVGLDAEMGMNRVAVTGQTGIVFGV